VLSKRLSIIPRNGLFQKAFIIERIDLIVVDIVLLITSNDSEAPEGRTYFTLSKLAFVMYWIMEAINIVVK